METVVTRLDGRRVITIISQMGNGYIAWGTYVFPVQQVNNEWFEIED